jgi:RNA polymerase sigma-70 factor (ECF subfamily)
MTWEQQMEQLARERGPALVGYAYLLTGDLAAAQDLTQDALVHTFSRRTRDDVDFLEAYVRRAILNAYLNARRRTQRWGGRAHLVVVGETSAGPDAIVADRTDIHTALARLSPRERACVVLRHFDDLTIHEIATRLDLSDGAVKRYLSDARHRLAPMLGDRERDDVDVITEGARR